MSFEQWLIIALACLGGAVSPGPSLALVMRHASTRAAAGYLCAWSHAAGVGVYAALAATGLAVLFAQNRLLDVMISAFASLWLARIAILSWHEAKHPPEPAKAGRSALRDGLSMGLLNPKVALFFMALFTAALPNQVSPWGQGLAVLTAILVDGLWYSLVTAGLQLQWVQPWLQKHLSLLAKLSALILAGFALFLLLRLLQSLV